MKKYFLFALILMVMLCVACENKQTDGDPTVAPAPSQFTITGSVTDDMNHPLPSIKITVDDPKVNPTEWDFYYADLCNTDKEGQFGFPIASKNDRWDEVEFPQELALTAKDASGIYESQTKTFSVEVRHRYPEGSQWYIVRDGHVQADFVLKKK